MGAKKHAEGFPKEDLKLLRGYIKELDDDIKEAAEKVKKVMESDET